MRPSSLTAQCLPFWRLAPANDQPQLVATALTYTSGTDLSPGSEERHLLTQFVLGHLTLEQVLAQLPQA